MNDQDRITLLRSALDKLLDCVENFNVSGVYFSETKENREAMAAAEIALASTEALAATTTDQAPGESLTELKKLQIMAGCALDDMERLHAEFGFPEDEPINVDNMIEAIQELQAASLCAPSRAPSEPVAWAVYNKNGNIRIWFGNYDTALGWAAGSELPINELRPLAFCDAEPIQAATTPHTYGGFSGSFYYENRRNPTNQEAFSAGMRAGRDLTNTTPAPHADEAAKWISVDEQLPEINQLVMVYSPPTEHDHPGEVNVTFDCIDPNDDDHASWLNHNEHYEHFCCVAKPEGSIGPRQEAPYTHWMPLPAAPVPPAEVKA